MSCGRVKDSAVVAPSSSGISCVWVRDGVSMPFSPVLIQDAASVVMKEAAARSRAKSMGSGVA